MNKAHPLPWQQKDGTIADANGRYIILEPEVIARLLASVNMLQHFEVHELEGRSFEEFVSEQAFLSGIEATKDGTITGLYGSAAVALVSSFAGMMKGCSASNFLEIRGEHNSIGPFTVTIQRVEGLTPGQKLDAAEARAGQLAAKLDEIERQNPFSIRRHRHEGCGYHHQSRIPLPSTCRYGDIHSFHCIDAPDYIPSGQTVRAFCFATQTRIERETNESDL